MIYGPYASTRTFLGRGTGGMMTGCAHFLFQTNTMVHMISRSLLLVKHVGLLIICYQTIKYPLLTNILTIPNSDKELYKYFKVYYLLYVCYQWLIGHY